MHGNQQSLLRRLAGVGAILLMAAYGALTVGLDVRPGHYRASPRSSRPRSMNQAAERGVGRRC